jgi:hypothetical protein
VDPHPDHDDRPEPRSGGRSGVVAVVVIAAILIAVVAVHLAGGMAVHGS